MDLFHLAKGSDGTTLTQQYEATRDLLTGMAYTSGDINLATRSYDYDKVADGCKATWTCAKRAPRRDEPPMGRRRVNIENRRMMVEGQDYALYEANELNQYSSISGAEAGEQYNFTPTFDDAGNQTSVKTETGIWTVSYNAENRPVTFTRTNADGTSTKVSCAYDYMGRRTTKKVETIAADNTATTTLHQLYLYRGYLQVACCDLMESGNPCRWFLTWDPTQPVVTRPLAIRKDGTWYSYGWDLTKNICEVFTADATLATTYSYSPYGAVTAAGDVTQPIQWSSEYHDTELALVYYNYRHYNPMAGRWIGRDPYYPTQTANQYARREVIHAVDRLGLDDTDTAFGILMSSLGSHVGQVAQKAAKMALDKVMKEVVPHTASKTRFTYTENTGWLKSEREYLSDFGEESWKRIDRHTLANPTAGQLSFGAHMDGRWEVENRTRMTLGASLTLNASCDDIPRIKGIRGELRFGVTDKSMPVSYDLKGVYDNHDIGLEQSIGLKRLPLGNDYYLGLVGTNKPFVNYWEGSVAVAYGNIDSEQQQFSSEISLKITADGKRKFENNYKYKFYFQEESWLSFLNGVILGGGMSYDLKDSKLNVQGDMKIINCSF